MMESVPSIDEHLAKLPRDPEKCVLVVPGAVKAYLTEVRTVAL